MAIQLSTIQHQSLHYSATKAFLQCVFNANDSAENLAPRYIKAMEAGRRSPFNEGRGIISIAPTNGGTGIYNDCDFDNCGTIAGKVSNGGGWSQTWWGLHLR